MDRLNLRVIKNIVVIAGIIVCLIMLFKIYNDVNTDIAKQERERNKTDIVQLQGDFNEKAVEGAGGDNYAKAIKKTEQEDDEEEEIQKKQYVNIKVDIELYVKIIGLLACIVILVVYLMVSGGQKVGLREMVTSSIRMSIFGVTVVLLLAVSALGSITLIKDKVDNLNNKYEQVHEEKESVSIDAVHVLDNKDQKFEGTYKSIKMDQNVFVSQNKAELTIASSKIDKTGINSHNDEKVRENGVNSAILATNRGVIKLKDVTVFTDSDGASGLFATEEDSRIEAQNMVINALGNKYSYGISATNKGRLILKEFEIVTNGAKCAGIVAGEKGGVVESKSGNVVTCGETAPVVYTNKSGTATLNEVNGEAKSSSPIIMDGASTLNITNSEIMGYGKGYYEGIDEAVTLIRSESSDYTDRKAAVFKCSNSVIGINERSDYYRKAPTFVIANTVADIYLSNTRFDQGNRILFDVKAIRELGVPGKNGGMATVTTKGQKLIGYVKVDKHSEFTLKLNNGSAMAGGINYLNSGAKKVELEIDATSKFILTTNMYLTKFTNADKLNSNINFGNFKIFVNGKPIN